MSGSAGGSRDPGASEHLDACPLINRPASGARFVLELDRSAAPATVYRGYVHLPDADCKLLVRVDACGTARAELDGAPGGDRDPAALAKLAAALVKVATKSAALAKRSPPRKIVRWRG